MQNIFINKSSGMGFIILDKTDVFYKIMNISNKLKFNISKNEFEMGYYRANLIEILDFEEFYNID